jgi:N6-adenosine-specific RNA methylase IME4
MSNSNRRNMRQVQSVTGRDGYAGFFAREKRDGRDCWGDQVDLFPRGQS